MDNKTRTAYEQKIVNRVAIRKQMGDLNASKDVAKPSTEKLEKSIGGAIIGAAEGAKVISKLPLLAAESAIGGSPSLSQSIEASEKAIGKELAGVKQSFTPTKKDLNKFIVDNKLLSKTSRRVSELKVNLNKSKINILKALDKASPNVSDSLITDVFKNTHDMLEKEVQAGHLNPRNAAEIMQELGSELTKKDSKGKIKLYINSLAKLEGFKANIPFIENMQNKKVAQGFENIIKKASKDAVEKHVEIIGGKDILKSFVNTKNKEAMAIIVQEGASQLTRGMTVPPTYSIGGILKAAARKVSAPTLLRGAIKVGVPVLGAALGGAAGALLHAAGVEKAGEGSDVPGKTLADLQNMPLKQPERKTKQNLSSKEIQAMLRRSIK